MSLAPGTRLGAYEVLALIGAGGMGEVYQARDTKLGRDVALKVLPGSFILDLERLARFKREAQVLASLNHPNIGGIYGLEDADGIHALVLESLRGLLWLWHLRRPWLLHRARWPFPDDKRGAFWNCLRTNRRAKLVGGD